LPLLEAAMSFEPSAEEVIDTQLLKAHGGVLLLHVNHQSEEVKIPPTEVVVFIATAASLLPSAEEVIDVQDLFSERASQDNHQLEEVWT